MDSRVSNERLLRFSGFIAETMGLHFPPSRWLELQRGIAAAAAELGFEDPDSCAQWLMSTPLAANQIETLANHLTVGETYFFREGRSFEILAEHILPKLIDAARGGRRRLRVWSAGCCTGEEPYSIAILLHRTIPDLEDWDVTLLATDINPRFLRKAEAGSYGQWSFRNAPAWLKERYFRATADGQFEVLPEIRRMVRFAQLNLVADAYPPPFNNAGDMDVIFCRNVLMYFTAPQAKKVVRKLGRAQADGGWLFVSPSECQHVLSRSYTTANFHDAILYQKERGPERIVSAIDECPADSPIDAPPTMVAQTEKVLDPFGEAAALYGQGRYAEAAEKLETLLSNRPDEPEALRLLARSLANQGKLTEALRCCDRWITADKLSPAGHYLRAVVLQEQGAIEEAVRSLQRTLCLCPRFVLAHFALGNIAHHRGRIHDAARHMENALRSLHDYHPAEPLPESDGITAERFADLIHSMTVVEAAA